MRWYRHGRAVGVGTLALATFALAGPMPGGSRQTWHMPYTSAADDPHGVDYGDYVYTVRFTYGGRGHRIRHLVECHASGAYDLPVAPAFPTLYGMPLPDGAGIAVKARSCGSEVVHARAKAGPFNPVLLYFPDAKDLSTATMYPDPVRQPPADGRVKDVSGWIQPADGTWGPSVTGTGFLSAEVGHDGLSPRSLVPTRCEFLGRWGKSADEATANASGWPWVNFNASHERTTWGMSWGDVDESAGHRGNPWKGIPYRNGMPDILGFGYDPVSRTVTPDPALDGTARCGRTALPYADHGHGDVSLDMSSLSVANVLQVVYVPTSDKVFSGGF